MTRSKIAPKLVITNDDIAAAELPATMPVLVESNAQIVQWQRELANADTERALIDEQIESAQRVRNAIADEAQRIFDATVHAADQVKARAVSDADKMCAATIEGLRRRQTTLDGIKAGLTAAVAATSQSVAAQ